MFLHPLIDHPDELDAVLKYFDDHPDLGWAKLPEEARNEFIKNERQQLVEHVFCLGHKEAFPEHYEKPKKPQIRRKK
jgi:hypothetical protein